MTSINIGYVFFVGRPTRENLITGASCVMNFQLTATSAIRELVFKIAELRRVDGEQIEMLKVRQSSPNSTFIANIFSLVECRKKPFPTPSHQPP
jgi:hypothetical protein